MDKDGTKRLFHHTSKEGAKAILESGKIKQSTNTKTDAAYGKGTYLTSIGPRATRQKVAENNYDGMAHAMEKQGRTDVIIGVNIPKGEAKKVSSKRDVYLVPNDVDLKGKNVTVYLRDGEGHAKKYHQK